MYDSSIMDTPYKRDIYDETRPRLDAWKGPGIAAMHLNELLVASPAVLVSTQDHHHHEYVFTHERARVMHVTSTIIVITDFIFHVGEGCATAVDR